MSNDVRGKPLLRTPLVQALLIQTLSLALVLALARGMPFLAETKLTIFAAASLQGAAAALISRLFGLAAWWLLIQALLPVALLATLALHLPPVVFRFSFIVSRGL
jgi:hypothetical protein